MRCLLRILACAVLATAVAAPPASAATYRGRSSTGDLVRFQIFSARGPHDAFVSRLEVGSACGISWVVNGWLRIRDGGFDHRGVTRHPGYYELRVVHGRMAGWSSGRRAWRRMSGTARVVYRTAATDTDPAVSCDRTFRWTARLAP